MFQQVTGVTLPRSAKEMSRIGDMVALADLQPGDLVFFNTRRFAFSHVGIYLGDNRFIHAPRRGREVEVATIDKSYWQKRFNGARRLIGVLPEMMPTLIAEASAAASELQVAPESPAELARISPLRSPDAISGSCCGRSVLRAGAPQPRDHRRVVARASPSRARSRRSGCGG